MSNVQITPSTAQELGWLDRPEPSPAFDRDEYTRGVLLVVRDHLEDMHVGLTQAAGRIRLLATVVQKINQERDLLHLKGDLEALGAQHRHAMQTLNRLERRLYLRSPGLDPNAITKTYLVSHDDQD